MKEIDRIIIQTLKDVSAKEIFNYVARRKKQWNKETTVENVYEHFGKGLRKIDNIFETLNKLKNDGKIFISKDKINLI